jgi:DNA-binding NarL/FixJ family response regulator
VGEGRLVGRARELERLEALAMRAADGQGAVCVITGEPGIGKTRLVERALAGWKSRGFETYAAAAWEMEQRRPFGLISDALRLRDPADGGRSERDPAGVDFQVAERLIDLIEDQAMTAPVAIVVEDLQWADPPSLTVLGWLAREGAQLRLLLACTLRPDPARQEVRALLATLDRLGVPRIELGPLGDGEVTDLVAAAVGGPPADGLLHLVSAANGNPLHITELVAALRADHALATDQDGRVDVADGQVPVSLRKTMLHRLARLPEPVRDLLRAGSVLGSAFTVGELETVVSGSAGELAAGLRAAIDAGVLIEDGEGLAFSHELIREALYEDMPRPVRRARHRAAARLLAAAGARSDRVAEHWVTGADPGDMEAVAWLRRAAEEIAARSPAVAVDLFQRASDLCPRGEPARAEILAQMTQPLAWTGRREELEELCRRALRGEGRSRDEMTFRLGLAHSLFIRGQLAEAKDAYQQAGVSAAIGEPERAMLGAYAALSGAMAGETSPAETARPLTATELGPVTSGIARMAVAVAELNAGHADRAVAELEALAGEGASDRWGSGNLLLRAAALTDLDELDNARTMLRHGAMECARNGTAARTAIHHHNLVAVEYAAGDFDTALAEHDTGMTLAEESGHIWRVRSLGVAAAIAVHRGDLTKAATMITAAEEQIASFGPHPADVDSARARYLLARANDDAPLAFEAAAQAWDRCASHGYRSQLTRSAVDLASAALAVGDRERAAAAAAAAQPVAEIAPATCWQGCAAQARGLAGNDLEQLMQAVTLLRASHRPLYLAFALEDAAEALARAARAEQARPLAAEALDLFDGLGAVTDAARARRRWRAASLHVGARGARGRPRTGWESLSEGELRVVRLVAEGRTNRDIAAQLFITRDTVHTHVSHALRKLGLSSRVELAAQAARRGL